MLSKVFLDSLLKLIHHLSVLNLMVLLIKKINPIEDIESASVSI